jgi:hypothetical protein
MDHSWDLDVGVWLNVRQRNRERCELCPADSVYGAVWASDERFGSIKIGSYLDSRITADC